MVIVICFVALAFYRISQFSVGKEVLLLISDKDSDLVSSLANEGQKLTIFCSEGNLIIFQTSDSHLYLCLQQWDGTEAIVLDRNKRGLATDNYSVLDFTSRMTATFWHLTGTNICSFVRLGCSGELISFLDKRGDGRFVILRREGEDLGEAVRRAIEREKNLQTEQRCLTE